jgi:outer membrane protein OmpA-like peptidoglycan-associated protein
MQRIGERRGRRWTGLLCSVAALLPLASPQPACAQQIEQGVAIVSEAIASRVDGFAYRPDSSSDLDFRGTALAPRADGSARIRTGSDRTEISAKFSHLPVASSFGPFTVYVLWVVTPEGRASNVGAVNLDGDKGTLNATTPLSSFALIVTAEPHFAVSVPSQFIVLQNVGGTVQGTQLVVTSLAARADYSGLKAINVDPKLHEPIELLMARYAVTIAEGSGAAQLAPQAFGGARDALMNAESAQLSKSSSVRERVPELARAAIQSAEDARAAAVSRREAALLEQLHAQISDGQAKLVEASTLTDKSRSDAAAQIAQLKEQIEESENRRKQTEQRLPTAASRQALAVGLLGRWLVMESDDKAITAHVTNDGFNKGRTDLTPDAKDRLATAAGILLGIGNLTVTVTPALQLTEDVKQLGLSQQRARALMEWLDSMGLKAVEGVPPDASASAAVERALAPGPGVDLVISFDAAG